MSSEEQHTASMSSQQIPTKGGSPQIQQSPVKKRRAGITLAQKQALIENLQLELTERARKLRANYNIHAQSLRTRVEIRVNRIPLALRKLTMGELFEKYSTREQQKPGALRGPPVPTKDSEPSRPPITRGPGTIASSSIRPVKRRSHEISTGDKENEVQEIETPNKRIRGHPNLARNTGHALSPTTSNSRVAPRNQVTATPGRSGIARPAVTPARTAGVATNILNNMARSVARPTAPPTARKMTTSAAASSSNTASTTGTAAARKRGATVTAASAPSSQNQSRPGTRMTRRTSGNSESSETSTSTVVRKRPMTAPPGAAPKPPVPPAKTAKRTTGGTVKKGVSTGPARKAPAAKAGGASSTTGAARTLRKRA